MFVVSCKVLTCTEDVTRNQNVLQKETELSATLSAADQRNDDNHKQPTTNQSDFRYSQEITIISD